MVEGMLAEPWHLKGYQESRLRKFSKWCRSTKVASHATECDANEEGYHIGILNEPSHRQSRDERREVLAMINASQIKEHMDVKGSDGKHVGTVLGVEKDRLKVASGGMDHDIDLAMVDTIKNDSVCLLKTSGETVQLWH